MLNPDSRCLYTSALTPPLGMLFDEAIATTFSMDPTLLLEAPVYLAFMNAGDQGESNPLSVLEAIRRYSSKISVYVQKGRIQVPQVAKPNPLYGYLEDMIIEVKSPNGGVFHPKVWLIRFVSPDKASSLLRLVVLTRNMTTDHSWDLSLQLEGEVTDRKFKVNKPLVHFINMLPGLGSKNLAQSKTEQAARFAEDVHGTKWQLPEGFDELAFYLPGVKAYNWVPPVSRRMVVISPFCSDEALRDLVKDTGVAAALISRPETLAALKPDTLNRFSQCLNLEEAAEIEDGEEESQTDQPLSTGLHAKVYLYETKYHSDYTHIIMGSANATNAALRASRNIEILVGLTGRKNKIGGIDELLGGDGLGDYLTQYVAGKESVLDTERQNAEKDLETALREFTDADLSLLCQAADKENQWSLQLVGHIPPLAEIVTANAWPITLSRDFAVDITAANVPGIMLGEFSASSVTGLIAFELKTGHPDVSARFVLNLPVTGMPDERNAAILQTIINNQDSFIRYLLLLLGNNSTYGVIEPGSGGSTAKWLIQMANGEDIPLLEELTRAYSRYPERLHEIAGLIRELLSADMNNKVIPDEFLNLWSIFESVLVKRNG